MVDVRPFRALRPPRALAPQVAAPPYDVVDTAQARRLIAENPRSFLRVSRPEATLPPDTDPHDARVYETGRDRFEEFVRDGVLRQDRDESYYVYRQTWRGRDQTGVVACVSVADYASGTIRTHEHTRPDKENDRARHIDVLDAHDEPVFLASPSDPTIAARVATVLPREPEYDFTTGDGVRHTLWVVDSPVGTTALRQAFASLPRLYVADGHHRSAAAQVVHRRRTERGDASAQDGLFPAVIFPIDDLRILPYNRVITSLGDRDAKDLPELLAESFDIEESTGPVDPGRRHEFGLHLPGRWFRLRARDTDRIDDDPVAGLDVSVLQDRVLDPLLGITDPRTDPRLAFVGGIHGTAELERLVDSGQAAAAFSLHATTPAELLAVADAGEVMPPKSTWFEPKLRSGLFVHAMRSLSQP